MSFMSIGLMLCISAVCNNEWVNNSIHNTNVFIEKNVESTHLISQSLQELNTTNTFHLFSHGRVGELLLGNKWRDTEEIVHWFQQTDYLKDKAYLNIYGCEFAKGKKGQLAVQFLEKELGISIAASDDLTGKGGDWDLEIGQATSSVRLENYPHNLQGCCDDTHSNGSGGHNHVKSLTLKYTGPSGNVNLYTNDGSGGTGVTNITQFVTTGSTVIFAAAGSQKYGSNSDWTYPGGNVSLHTSCSRNDVVLGATFGPFEILGIVTANGCSEGQQTTCQDAGTNGTLSICPSTTVTTSMLFNALGGSPNAGGTWSPTPNGLGTYTYTHAAVSGCPNSTAQVVVSSVGGSDKDSDGVVDVCDLDDDNDGILDVDEGATVITSGSPAIINWTENQLDGLPGSFNTTLCNKTVSVSYSGNASDVGSKNSIDYDAAASVVEGSSLSVNRYLDIEADPGEQWTVAFDISPGDFNSLTLYISDIDDSPAYSDIEVQAFSGGTALSTATSWIIQTLETNGTTPANNPPTINTTTNKLTLTPNTGGSNINNDVVAIQFPTSTLASADRIRVKYTPSSGSASDNIRIFLSSGCSSTTITQQDTDNDNIPNDCDTDSDNDGCPDAIEGGGAFAQSDLDANNRLTGGVDLNGIPNVVAPNGQTVGNSQDNTVQDAACATVCNDITNGGTIGSNEAQCTNSGYTPNVITSISLPSGGSGGTLVYLWQYQDGTSPVPGAWVNTTVFGIDYNPPGPITQSRMYRRLARRSTCTSWLPSNIVTKTVNPVPMVDCGYSINNTSWQSGVNCQVTVDPGDNLRLLANPSPYTSLGTWTWAGPNGFNANGRVVTVSNNVTAAMAGNYVVTYTNPSGCSIMKTITVTVNPSLTTICRYKIGTNAWVDDCQVAVCEGSQLRLTQNSSTTGGSWLWTGPNGFTASIRNPIISTNITPADAGNYQAEYTVGRQTSIKIFTVTVNSPPPTVCRVNVDNSGWQNTCQATVCAGSELRLALNSSVTGGTWNWTSTSTNGFTGNVRVVTVTTSFTPADAGTYTATYTSPDGCTSTKDFTITNLDNFTNPGTIAGNQNNCGSYNPSTIISAAAPSGGSAGNPVYQWQYRNGTSGTWIDAFGANSATYDPPSISQTRQYRRLASKEQCSTPIWIASNIVIKTVTIGQVASNTTSTATIQDTETKALVGSPSGGTWSIVTGGGSISGTTYTPPIVSGNTTVTVRYTIAANGACPATTADRTFMVVSGNPCDPAISGNIDTDGDGVSDVCDLDDDNDGILDTDEGCPDCSGNSFINGDFEGGPFPSTFVSTNENNVPGWFTTATDNRIEIWANGHSSGNTGGPVPSQSGGYHAEINGTQDATLYQQICTRPGAQISWSVWHRGRAGTDVAVVKIGEDIATAPIQTTMTTGNTVWVQYSGIYTVPLNQNFTYFIFESVSTASGSAGNGNFIDNIVIQEIVPGVCLDTDGDGIINSLDPDSDNDGCPDALEGGGTFTHLDIDGNDRLTGSVNGDGLPTVAAPNGQSVGSSTDNAVSACCDAAVSGFADTDSDGIIDLCDNDDDNDGILDTEEGYSVITQPTYVPVVYSNSLNSTGAGTVSGQLASIEGCNSQFTVNFSFVSISGDIPNLETANNNSHLKIGYPGGLSGTSQITYTFSQAVDVSLSSFSNAFVERITFITPYTNISPGNNSTIVSTNPVVWHNSNDGAPTTFEFTNVTQIVLGIQGNSAGQTQFMSIKGYDTDFCIDTDGDGTVDAKDLDSDGDGCIDVVESGGTDANNDGILDGTGFDNDGLVTGGVGGYDGANGNEYVAHQLSVPNPVTSSPAGPTATFFNMNGVTAESATSYNSGTPVYGTVGNADAGINYRWYSGNPTSGGTVLTDNGAYVGTTTNTLRVNGTLVNFDQNDYEFCVLITHDDNSCLSEVRCKSCDNFTDGGTIGSDEAICNGSSPNAITTISAPSGGSGGIAEYQWEQRVSGGAWTDISGANAETYNPGPITQTTQYRRKTRRNTCTVWFESTVVTITVIENFTNPGTISGGGTYCNEVPSNITVTGTQLPSGTNISQPPQQYQWQYRDRAVCSSSWNNYMLITGETGQSLNNWSPPSTNADYQIIRRTKIGPCSNEPWIDASPVTFDVVSITNAGTIAGDESNCASFDPAAITLVTAPSGGCGGTLEYQWQQRVSGGNWTDISGANAATYDPGMITETTEYRRGARRNSCPYEYTSIIVTKTVLDKPVVTNTTTTDENCGNSDGSITIYFNDEPTQTTIEISIDGGVNYQYSSPDNVGSFTINNLSAGTYNLLARWSDGSCPIAINNAVVINNQNNPTACNPTVLFQKSTTTDTANMRETIIFTFTIFNNAGTTLNNVTFTDVLSNGGLFYSDAFDITNGMQVIGSSINTGSANFTLNNVQVGSSSFSLAVDVPSGLPQWTYYCNQATINNLKASNPNLPSSINSDNPATPAAGDPTCVLVKIYENCCNGTDDDGDGLDDCDDPDCNH